MWMWPAYFVAAAPASTTGQSLEKGAAALKTFEVEKQAPVLVEVH
jgi:hypothetical protein